MDNKKTPHIEKFLEENQRLNPDEVEPYCLSQLNNDPLILEKIYTEQMDRFKQIIKDNPFLKSKIDDIQDFFAELRHDNIINNDFYFQTDNLNAAKQEQNRESTRHPMLVEYNDYKKEFGKLMEDYISKYEDLCKYTLKEIAEYINNGNPINSNGTVIKVIKEYKSGKFKDLFDCLEPQIRNSISHKNSLINKKKPEITFYDRNKPPMTKTLDEYKKICSDLFYTSLGFDYIKHSLTDKKVINTINMAKKAHSYAKMYGLEMKINENHGIRQGIPILDFVKIIDELEKQEEIKI